MTPFDKELSCYLDRQADACDVWESIQCRIQAGKGMNTSYIPEPVEPPRKKRGRIAAFAAAAATLMVAVAGALVFVTRHAGQRLEPVQPGIPAASTQTKISAATDTNTTDSPMTTQSEPQTSSAQGELRVGGIYPGGALIWIELEQYDKESNTIHAQIHNETADEYTYGMYFSMLRRENEKWVPCKSAQDWAIPDIAALLEPRSKRPQSFCLDAYFPNGLEPGDFRIELQLWAAGEEAQNVVVPLEMRAAYR